MDKETKRIGVFGGTFDPLHNGHITILETAVREYQLDQVIVIPTGKSPHKAFYAVTDPEIRLEMCQLALTDMDEYMVSDLEIRNEGTSYTYDTLGKLNKLYPNDQLYFILGADSLYDFYDWRHPEIILQEAIVLAAVRDEHNLEELEKYAGQLEEEMGGQIQLLHCPAVDISSRKLRQDVLQGKSIADKVPEAIAEYISKHGLYSNHMEDLQTIMNILKEELKESRYIHTIGVMETAMKLAEHYSYSVKQAQIAGLLHDCAKNIPDSEKIDLCLKYGFTINDAESKNISLLHAKAGAILAKVKYGVNDVEILHAIQVHTTGCQNMNVLDKIVYIADYIEPGRNQAPNLEMIRHLSYEDLDDTMYYILKDTVSYLSGRNDAQDPETMKAYDYYKEIYGKVHGEA